MTDRQRVFAEEYAKSGNATAAAKAAGYSHKSAYSQGQRMLKNDEVMQYIRRLQDEAARQRLLSVVRIKAFLSDVITDPAQKTSDRLKASDMFLKSAGAYMHIRPDPDAPGGFAFGEYDGEETIICLPPIDKDPSEDELAEEVKNEIDDLKGWTIIK